MERTQESAHFIQNLLLYRMYCTPQCVGGPLAGMVTGLYGNCVPIDTYNGIKDLPF